MSQQRVPGTSCRIAYDFAEPGATMARVPLEGDFLRTVPGSCYLIDRVRQSPKYPTSRVYLTCTRMERGAVQFGDPGVWPLHWHHGRRRRA